MGRNWRAVREEEYGSEVDDCGGCIEARQADEEIDDGVFVTRGDDVYAVNEEKMHRVCTALADDAEYHVAHVEV